MPMTPITAQLLASLMVANADALHDGRTTREAYQAEQDRLWALAADAHLSKAVARVIIRRVA